MKQLILLAAAWLVLASPAAAQNAGQVATAQRGASCPGCNLFQANLGGAQLNGRNFAHARLRQSDLSLSVMNHTSFAGADLRDVDAYGAVFSSANFSGADLTHASFVGTFLEGASFSGARLDGTNFAGAEMTGVRGLTQAQLDRACGDGSTALPRGLRIPIC